MYVKDRERKRGRDEREGVRETEITEEGGKASHAVFRKCVKRTCQHDTHRVDYARK